MTGWFDNIIAMTDFSFSLPEVIHKPVAAGALNAGVGAVLTSGSIKNRLHFNISDCPISYSPLTSISSSLPYFHRSSTGQWGRLIGQEVDVGLYSLVSTCGTVPPAWSWALHGTRMHSISLPYGNNICRQQTIRQILNRLHLDMVAEVVNALHLKVSLLLLRETSQYATTLGQSSKKSSRAATHKKRECSVTDILIGLTTCIQRPMAQPYMGIYKAVHRVSDGVAYLWDEVAHW